MPLCTHPASRKMSVPADMQEAGRPLDSRISSLDSLRLTSRTTLMNPAPHPAASAPGPGFVERKSHARSRHASLLAINIGEPCSGLQSPDQCWTSDDSARNAPHTTSARTQPDPASRRTHQRGKRTSRPGAPCDSQLPDGSFARRRPGPHGPPELLSGRTWSRWAKIPRRVSMKSGRELLLPRIDGRADIESRVLDVDVESVVHDVYLCPA
ncbi:hypothetical protein OH76DRAFT_203404 [Lentinus brumalis]|uniref:Uncharacterized protein n=1 Tax=Lentinus brumalis TaxID=2498619 RepID=A0A371DIB3_9APHY|nr:hypothetical protein OH76DRAFT_203404 [Polyporus brumalis]